jgi:acyl-CoA synthetase (NDP forming)
MANQDAYLESTEVFANSKEVDAILFCAVPLTDKLETTDHTKITDIANGLKNISLKSSTPILVVVDSGIIYNKYRDAFKRVGLPTFNSIEESFLALKYKSPGVKPWGL